MTVGAVVLTGIVLFTGLKDVNDPAVTESRRAFAKQELRTIYLFPILGAVIGFLGYKGWHLFDFTPPPPEKFVVAPGAMNAIRSETEGVVMQTETSRGNFLFTMTKEDVPVAKEAFEWKSYDIVLAGLAKRDPTSIYVQDFEADAPPANAETLAAVELVRHAMKRSLSADEQRSLAKYDSENGAIFGWFGSPINAPDDYCDGFAQAGRPESARGMLLLLEDGALDPRGQAMLGAWIAGVEPGLTEGLVALADRPELADSVRSVLGSLFERGRVPARAIAGEWAIMASVALGVESRARAWVDSGSQT